MTPALHAGGPEFDSRSPHSTHHLCGQHGRAVKALDSKSNGLCPRGFESLCCRAHTYTEREKKNTFCAPIVQWLEFALPKREVRVRFPVGAVKKKKNIFFFLSLCLLRSAVPVAQWIRRETTNLETAGSSPVGDNDCQKKNIFFSLSPQYTAALVAQWIAHWTSNPEAAGSSPVKSACGQNHLTL